MKGDRIWSHIVTMIGRKTYFQRNLDAAGYDSLGYRSARARAVNLDEANLVSSELPNGKHAPAIDLDHSAHLLPSSTPGKYHLYIDEELTWEQYKALLEGFYKAGLIEEYWYKTALKDKRTYLRLPHIKKPKMEGDDAVGF